MTHHDIRDQSLKIALNAGLRVPSTLPLLDAGLRARGAGETEDRLLCLTAIAAASYGFDKMKAFNWILQEHLESALTHAERCFIERGEGNPRVFQTQVESMWALAWALDLVAHFDFWKDCDSNFVVTLPNLRIGESGAKLRSRSRMRSTDDLFSACDLAYCLHWAVRQSEINGEQKVAGLKPFVVAARRRALEWLLSNEPWDAVSLDT